MIKKLEVNVERSIETSEYTTRLHATIKSLHVSTLSFLNSVTVDDIAVLPRVIVREARVDEFVDELCEFISSARVALLRATSRVFFHRVVSLRSFIYSFSFVRRLKDCLDVVIKCIIIFHRIEDLKENDHFAVD